MHVLTLIAAPGGALTETVVCAVAHALRAERWVWLSEEEAADLFFAVAPDDRAVADCVGGRAIDAVCQAVAGREKRLLVADMDSTMVTSETLDELAGEAGLKDEVAAITELSMNGQIDFSAALTARVALLKGLELAALERVWAATGLMPGGGELIATMRARGAVCALVTGGFDFFASRAAATLGFDTYRANTFKDDGHRLTGELATPILDRAGKRAALTELAAQHGLRLDETLAVGDGANDLDMLGAAGMGIAYHAKPIVASAARARVDHADLRGVLFVQGIS